MRLEEETARLKIQVHLRELEREAWRKCATQLASALNDPDTRKRREALANYEQLSRPDSDYAWPE